MKRMRLLNVGKLFLLLAFLVITACVLAIGHKNPDYIQDFVNKVQDYGPAGGLLFVALFAILQPFGVGSHGFILASALIWDPWLAFFYSSLGCTLSGCLAFGYARYIGQEWVQQRIPPKLQKYQTKLMDRPIRTMLVMRLVFFTFSPMQLMLGVSRVRFWDYLLTMVVGNSPLIIVEVMLGNSLFLWLISNL